MAPEPSLELILYLGELTRTVEKGFDRLDDRMDHLDQRIGQLEQWHAVSEDRHEQQDKRDDDVSGPDWVKIILALVAVLGTALTIIAQKGF